MPVQAPDLTQIQEGGEVDLGAAGKYRKTPIGYEPLVISTEQGADFVRKDQETLDKLSGLNPLEQANRDALRKSLNDPNANLNTRIGSPIAEDKPAEGSITYINPATGQTQKLSSSSLTPEAMQSLKLQGYQLSESEGSIPSWMLSGDLELAQKEKELSNVRVDFDNLKGQLSKFTVSDADLQNQITSITNQWDARIAEMENINTRRAKSIETTGLRLGSRYTGGAGGVFGGIIAEEERQGVLRIGELESRKQEAISAAREAARTKNWEVFSKQVGLAETAYKEKQNEVKELNKTVVENNKKIREQEKQAIRDSAIADLYSQGITNPTELLDNLNLDESGRQVGDFTMKEVTNYLELVKKVTEKTFHGIVQEWHDAIQSEAIPPDSTLADYIKTKNPMLDSQLQKMRLDIKKLELDIKNKSENFGVGAVLTDSQKVALTASGISQDVAGHITLAILGGSTLEEIRQALKADGLDTKILDTYDRIVNIKGLLEKSRFKSSSNSDDEPSY